MAIDALELFDTEAVLGVEQSEDFIPSIKELA